MGPIVRAVAAGIGLARESHLSKKAARQGGQTRSPEGTESKEAEIIFAAPPEDLSPDARKDTDYKNQPQSDDIPVDIKGLSLQPTTSADDSPLPLYGSWELDEVQDSLAEQEEAGGYQKVIGPGLVPQKDIPHLAEKFATAYPITDKADAMRLNCSVIIPQRRPDSRKRGFIRAYSPVLAAKGIDEDCFLDFIDVFNVASSANPLINAINLASFAAFALPPGIGIAVSEAIRLAVDTTVELQSRYRTNHFLDQINKLWFLPRGLICFPMIWKPSVSSLVTSVAMDNTASVQFEGLDQKTSTIGKFSGGAAVTRGNVAFPDAAPLTFPLLDDLADTNDEGARTFKQKLAGSMKFANEYMDRRAHATYAMKNPNSGLTHLGVRPEFRSRYSDPSHPAASGSLLGLITGGKISTHNLRVARRQNQRGRLSIQNPSVDSTTTAVGDFMRDIRLSNVIRTMRGKVSVVDMIKGPDF